MHIVYTDYCTTSNKVILEKDLDISIIVRDINKWDIPYIASIVCDPALKIVVINRIEDISILEIGIALLMCKDVLVASNGVHGYKHIYDTVTYMDANCRLDKDTCAFKDWYKYTYK